MTRSMPLPITPYCDQGSAWPSAGRHILAQYDDDTIVVYQAYSQAIGGFALQHGYFGGDFKYTRMSWIKPNFLWMMYRSDWGRSEGQHVVLALRLRREFFDSLLAHAVPSSFTADLFENHAAWKLAVEESDVRLQWDPDHFPTGEPTQRRAIQLGLRNRALDAYGMKGIVEIIDMSEFVSEQRANTNHWQVRELVTPTERVYLPAKSICARVGLESS